MLFDLISMCMSVFVICMVLVKTLVGNIRKQILVIWLIVFFCILLFSKFGLSESNFKTIFTGMMICFPIFTPIIAIRGIRKKQMIYLIFIILGLITSLSSLLQWILNTILPFDITISSTDFIINTLFLLICIITIRRDNIGKLFGSIFHIRLFLQYILLGSIWASGLLTSLFSRFYLEYPILPGLSLIGLLTAILIILVGIICPLLIINTLSNLHYKNLSTLMDKQVRLQVSHYETLSEVNENIMRFRHDYNNIRVGIIGLLNRADIAGAMTLLNANEILSSELTVEFETGCHVLDALLNEKQASAATVNASIEFDGVVPGNLLNPADVCVIFGNTLDNAIEACEKCSAETNKVITIQSTFTNGFLFIKIANPVAFDVNIMSNTIATTKENANKHGIGLQTIRTSVEKNSGDMVLSCENSVFTIQIDLDLNE